MRFPVQKSAVVLLFVLALLPSPGTTQEAIDTVAVDSSATTVMDSTAGKTVAAVQNWRLAGPDIASVFAVDILDYLILLPTTQALDRGSLGQLSPLTHRGASPAASSVLLDGLPLLEPIGGSVNTKYLPLNLIRELTCLGYGQSAAFGHLSPGGATDFSSYFFRGQRPYSKVVFRAGDFGYSDMGAIFGLPINKHTNFLLDGTRQTLSRTGRSHTGSRVFARISHQPESWRLNYRVLLNRNDLTIPAPVIPTISPGSAVSQFEETRIDQALTLGVGRRSGRELNTRLLFTHIDQNSEVDTLRFDNRNVSIGGGVDYGLTLGPYRLRLGSNLLVHHLDSPQLGDHTDGIGSLFVRGEVPVAVGLDLRLQLILEKRNGYAARFQPAGQLNFQWAESARLWLGVQTATRYPTFSERFWPMSSFRSNRSLNPEDGLGAEIGLHFKNTAANFQATVFARESSDWLGYEIVPGAFAVEVANLGTRSVFGADLKLVWRDFYFGELGLVGSVLQVRQSQEALQLQVPEFTGLAYFESGRSVLEEFIYVRLRLSGRFYGQRHSIDYLTESGLPKFAKLEPAALLDGQVSFEFKDAKLVVAYENLLNLSYELVRGFEMPKRTFRFGIEWEFWD